MANSILRININQPIPIGGQISFSIDSSIITYQWVASRTGIGQVTASSTITGTINNLVTAIGLDYPSLLTPSYSGSGNQLDITTVSSTALFSNGQAPNLNVSFIYINASRTIYIENFVGDTYLINNEIIMDIQALVSVETITVSFYNLTNQNQSPTFKLYTKDNKAKLNIAPAIKSLFSYPSEGHDYATTGQIMPNINTVRITINHSGNVIPYQLVKTFVRGGNRTTKTNQTLSDGIWLTPSDKIPVWAGYPVAGYYLEVQNNARVITKKLINDIPTSLIDQRRTKGCSQMYVKFLNQMGGYSHWLFDTFSESETNTNYGSFVRANEIEDLGNDASSKFQVTGKVPKEYINLIKDLAVSPEIYIYKNLEWVRVLSDKNPVVVEDTKRSYNVKMNFILDYRFNPALIWSN